MASIKDKVFGYGVCAIAIALFSYLTVWLVFLPFIDPKHPIQLYFPSRYYAILVPCVIGLFAVGILGLFVAVTMYQDKIEQKAKQRKVMLKEK